jgi:hypothetical protein
MYVAKITEVFWNFTKEFYFQNALEKNIFCDEGINMVK